MGNHYDVKPFDLHGLVGISDRTLEMHFKLYEGYVNGTNQLTTEIEEIQEVAHENGRHLRRQAV